MKAKGFVCFVPAKTLLLCTQAASETLAVISRNLLRLQQAHETKNIFESNVHSVS
jgi:hypothetical protein